MLLFRFVNTEANNTYIVMGWVKEESPVNQLINYNAGIQIWINGAAVPTIEKRSNIIDGFVSARPNTDHLKDTESSKKKYPHSSRLEQDIDPDMPLGNLRIGQQQIVEIAKSLAQDAKILILD
ncbi:MAG: hypothetical protein COC15_03855, partial [Legionellales bacterium]